MLAHLPNLLISQESPVFHSSLPVSSQGHNSPTFLLIEHNFSHFSPFYSSQPVPGYQCVVCRAGAPRHPQAVRDRQKKWRRDRILKHISDTLERRIPISYVKFFFFLKEMRRKICQACFFLSITGVAPPHSPSRGWRTGQWGGVGLSRWAWGAAG